MRTTRKRKRKSSVGRWYEYEREKARIKSRQLSPAEYEEAIRTLSRRLKV